MELIERLVVFSIFMENGKGIVGKAPDYIMEKWALSQAKVSDEFIIARLDQKNQSKFREWQRIWHELIVKEVKKQCPQCSSHLTKIKNGDGRLWYRCSNCNAQFPVQFELREIKRKGGKDVRVKMP